MAIRVLITIFVIILASCSMGVRHSDFVDGSLMTYVHEGQGGPTVVFEAGLGDGLTTWDSVFEEVAVNTRAFAYSRPGYGGGFPGPSEKQRTADDVARKTKALLEHAQARPPYVLVGHSIGGMYVLRFAQLYPELVAGVVLVDGRSKAFTSACIEAGLSPCKPPKVAEVLAPAHVAAEMRGIPDTERQVPEPNQLGDFPITVIAATKPPVGAPKGGQPIWLKTQSRFADQVKNGRYVEATGAGHYIHKDQPELVIGEILRLVQSLR